LWSEKPYFWTFNQSTGQNVNAHREVLHHYTAHVNRLITLSCTASTSSWSFVCLYHIEHTFCCKVYAAILRNRKAFDSYCLTRNRLMFLVSTNIQLIFDIRYIRYHFAHIYSSYLTSDISDITLHIYIYIYIFCILAIMQLTTIELKILHEQFLLAFTHPNYQNKFTITKLLFDCFSTTSALKGCSGGWKLYLSYSLRAQWGNKRKTLYWGRFCSQLMAFMSLS
jgi:hypothetical protein